MPLKRVFVDTNAIFPAIKSGEWKRLCGRFSIETVEAIVAETQKGDVNSRSYVVVEKEMLTSTLRTIHVVSEEDRAAFRLKSLELGLELDEGESELLAHLIANEKPNSDTLFLTCSDRAAVRAACELGWGDSMVSLAKLLDEAGAGRASLRSLPEHHTEAWLSGVRTTFRLKLVR